MFIMTCEQQNKIGHTDEKIYHTYQELVLLNSVAMWL